MKVINFDDMWWWQKMRYIKRIDKINRRMDKSDILRENEQNKSITIKRQILAALLSGDRLTVLSCWQRFRTTELRSVVCKLRKDGHNIISKRVTGQIYHEYFISEK